MFLIIIIPYVCCSVGFKSIYSDYFYNIQIDIGKDGVAENGFDKIQQILIS